MSGAINQVLNYKYQLTKNYYNLSQESDIIFNSINPKCVIIIGNTSNFDTKQIEAFELFRNGINNVEILSFNELIQRCKDILSIYDNDINPNEDYIIVSEDDELPF